MPADEFLISVDGHAQVSHDDVKANLATKFHAAYDDALGAFGKRMMERMTASNNAAWAQSNRGIKESSNSFRLRNMQREGHKEPLARLEGHGRGRRRRRGDLLRGQRASAICMTSRRARTRRRRRSTTPCTSSASPIRQRLIMNYQIPIHDIDDAIKEVQRVAAMGGKSLQLPVFPPEVGLPDYYHERYDPLLAAIQETGLPIGCHIGLNTMLEDLARRDPTPGGVGHMPLIAMSTAEALGMWIMGGVLERFPDLKLVFVEPGLGWIAWWIYIADDIVVRQGYETPAHQRAAELLLPPQRARHVHRRARRDPGRGDPLPPRRREHHVVERLPAPGVELAQLATRSSTRCSTACREDERDLMVSGNAKRVWNL